MMFARWMFVSLAYGAILYGPLFVVAIFWNPDLPDWVAVASGLGGMVLGVLGPTRHMVWIVR